MAAAAVTPTGKFILTQTCPCLLGLSRQMHGFLAKTSSVHLLAIGLDLGILTVSLSLFHSQYQADTRYRTLLLRRICTNLDILALAEVKAATLTVAPVVVTAAAVVTAVAVVVVVAVVTAVAATAAAVVVVTAAVVLPVVTA